MTHRLTTHLRGNVVAYIALMFSIIGVGGGGYAIAATTHHHTKHHKRITLTACVSNHTGEMLLHRRGRCSRGHHKVRWSIRGPRGRRGKTGARGAAGAPAPSIFAIVDAASVIEGAQPIEKGLTVARAGVGVYTITITDPTCSTGSNAPVVTPTSRSASLGPLPSGAAPVAFIQNNIGISGPSPFTVQTGYMSGGSFTPADLNFDVQDTCLPPTSSSAARR